ncbi:MAG: hypothetical protein KIT25_23250 [Enhydrobacter sp.]|nr:MAG: hypothetical protein KIT25_23250 [Enhydrobacter sp.]
MRATTSQPLNPVLKNMMILFGSGVVAALLSTNVYGATLALDEPASPAPVIASAPAKADDVAAAAALRAMLSGQRQLMGTVPVDNSRR